MKDSSSKAANALEKLKKQNEEAASKSKGRKPAAKKPPKKTSPKKATSKKKASTKGKGAKPPAKKSKADNSYTMPSWRKPFPVNASDNSKPDSISVFTTEAKDIINGIKIACLQADIGTLDKSQTYRVGLVAALYLAENDKTIFREICEMIEWRKKVNYKGPRQGDK